MEGAEVEGLAVPEAVGVGVPVVVGELDTTVGVAAVVGPAPTSELVHAASAQAARVPTATRRTTPMTKTLANADQSQKTLQRPVDDEAGRAGDVQRRLTA